MDLKSFDERILFMTLGRSGNHAVIKWFCSNLPGRVIFKNNVSLTTLNHKNQSAFVNAGEKKFLLCSMENKRLECFRKYDLHKKFDRLILILRDPYNWLASRLAFKGRDDNFERLKELNFTGFTFIELYKQYAAQIEGTIDLLKFPFFVVRFNDWFSSQKYRSRIARNVGMPCTDKGLNEVSKRGGGSSFDKRRYHKNGQKMDVLGRWRHYEKELKVLVDKEMALFSKKYFRFNPFNL